jgi:WD40 repeat protein
LRKALTQESLQFRFSGDLKTLYTVLKIAGECKLIQWNLEKLVENLGFQSLEATKDEHLPLTLTPMRVFTSTDPPSLLNFQPLLIKSFYNPRQFSFFYADERVTDSAIYTSSQQPAYLVGTNYGRLFITPLFQESDDRVQPVLVVDAHHGSPITRLFVAYNSARRQTGGKGFLRITTTAVSENGGHLISVSEDGTICVTNLNSGEINKALHNFNVLSAGIGVDKHDYHRAEQFFREREESRKLKRRNSFSNDCSVQKYFHLAKVRP